MPDRLNEIRARLDAATPGPWKRGVTRDDLPAVLSPSPNNWLVCKPGPRCEGDADLIAHAPADIAWLLGEVERLRAHRPARFPHGKPDTGSF